MTALTEEAVEALLKHERVPWTVNLTRSGERIVTASEWLYFARDHLGEVEFEPLDVMTTRVVEKAGGSRVTELHPRNLLRKLRGHKRLASEAAYAVPAAFFGQGHEKLGEQFLRAQRARREAD